MTKRDQKAQNAKEAYDKALASKDKALEDANKAHQDALAKLEKGYQDKLAQKEADAQKAREACQKAHAEKDAKIDSLTKELANKDDAAKKAEEAYKKQLADKDAELAKEKSRIVATRFVDKNGKDIFPTEINDVKPVQSKLIKTEYKNGRPTTDGTGYIQDEYQTYARYKNTTVENGVQIHHYDEDVIVSEGTDHL